MRQRIAVGAEDFVTLRRTGSYYVDKTELLYDLMEANNTVTLFTRPRRFGKTLNMTMLESFFSMEGRKDADLFSGLSILSHPEFCADHRNQYPVLFLSFKDVEGLTFESAKGMLTGEIAKRCIRYAFLEQDKKVDPADAQTFHRLKFKYASEEETKNAIQTIMRMMHAVYGKEVILLIDEYDVPLAKAYENGYYKEMLDLIRGVLSTALKTNEHLKFAVITGCLQITKERFFTGVNHFSCYSVLDKRFDRYFGFTGEEVERMLQDLQISNRMETMKNWYDGYIFGDAEVFCPWDVVSYASALLHDGEQEPENYWANTSGNGILKEFIAYPGMDVADKFETLLNRGTIQERVTRELTYDQLNGSEENLWSVLLMTGYVSKAEKGSLKGELELRIPNREIAEIFRDAVVVRFQKTLDRSKANALIDALWCGEEEKASQALSDILWQSISYYDYGEEYYHGVLNGLFSSRGYGIDSNQEAGLGRLDLRIRDKANRRVLVLECKRSRKETEMQADCQRALLQIRERGYVKAMPDGYITQLAYGIAFFGKKAKVMKL